MKITKNMYYNDTVNSRELYLYATNTKEVWDRNLYFAYVNLEKKIKKGTFDREKAVEMFYHTATLASDLYYKNYGFKFSVTERWTAAIDLRNDFCSEHGC